MNTGAFMREGALDHSTLKYVALSLRRGRRRRTGSEADGWRRTEDGGIRSVGMNITDVSLNHGKTSDYTSD